MSDVYRAPPPEGWTQEEWDLHLDGWAAQMRRRAEEAEREGTPSWLADDDPFIGGFDPED